MDRTDGSGNCSITVHLRQTEQVSGGGVLFEACRVGSVNASDGRMILNWDLGELNRFRPSGSTQELTKELSALLFSNRKKQVPETRSDQPGGSGKTSGNRSEKEERIMQAVTSDDGICTFRNLEEGAWLIHASDSSSYGTIEDTLAAVPCFVEQEGIWEGPVYDADVWPKGVIFTQEDQETGTQEKETEKRRVPKTEKPFQIDHTPAERIYVSETVPGTKTSTDTTTLQRITLQPSDSVKGPDPEKALTRRNREKPVPDHHETPSRQVTQQRTQPVQTLDNTPLSGLILVFLGCALVIVLILSRWRRKGSRNRIRHLALFSCTGMLLASGLAVRASGAQSDSFEQMLNAERKIVLINHAPDAPCLTVSKEVVDALNGSRAPEGEVFVFQLAVNGTRASRVRYRVFDRSGEEMVDLTGNGGQDLVPVSSASSDPVRLKTGTDGSFFLKDGQTALFEELSAGDLWEVTELDKDHYERIVPQSSATLSGTVLRNGSLARFVNRFLPEEEPDLTQGTIEITKRILWPEGIRLPERGRFRVRVLADRKPVSGGQVALCDLEEGSALSCVSTDEEGCFEIAGNQRASLQVPLGSDVYVEETDDPEDAFVPSGSVSWKGTAAPLTRVLFTNRLADFVVAKSLRSGDRQHGFTFCLLGPDDCPMGLVPYFLAAKDGALETSQLLYTDAEGHFTLRADQRAVFTGMEEGSRYSVREEKQLGYRQITPAGEGYSHLTVKKGVPVLSFENEKTDTVLFAPSAGGGGIVLPVAFAVMGIVMLVLWHDQGRKRSGERNHKAQGKKS